LPIRFATLRGAAFCAIAVSGSACASSAAAPPTAPSAAAAATLAGARGVPGFDLRQYPGAESMRTWRSSSPYRWVGYYLRAACHPRSSWTGRRAELERMGWGIALLYVGEQDWSAVRNPPAGRGTPGDSIPRCTSANLTAARGAADAAEADSVARAEGFTAGTTIYLDVERVDSVSAALIEYVSAWTAALVGGGTFSPGLYAHGANAEALHAAMVREFSRRGVGQNPPLWVASAQGFDILAAPAESGFLQATIWQGAFNTRETWGGVTLTIDINVAARDAGS
jgi:hypothetical protein